MILPENCRYRQRVIQGDVYTKHGQPDFTFEIPCPFEPAEFQSFIVKGVSAEGMAKMANQTLAENLSNTMAARIKNVVKHNKAADDETEMLPLPSQADMDALVAEYDFSGVRASTSESTALSAYDRVLYKHARKLIRKILKLSGYGDKKAPVTVAKKGEPPTATQIPFEEFENEVDELARGEGSWGDEAPFIAARDKMLEAVKSEVAIEAEVVEATETALGLSK